MKALYAIMAILTVLYILPVACKGGSKISGTTPKAAKESAKKVKRFLQADQRTEFDSAFGVLEEIKNTEGGEKAFLEAVNGLTPEEVVALMKKEVDAKIAARDGRFVQYQSGEDMLHKLTSANKSLRAMKEREQGSH